MVNRSVELPGLSSEITEGDLSGPFGGIHYHCNTESYMLEYDSREDNIESLREQFPEGMHFVVGDTHGEAATLADLMLKIRFDPAKDHVYFVGDYNAGGDVLALLRYMSNYYQPDTDKPGFHLIRGNHERELFPYYTLENLPDLFVIKGKNLNYYISHAGMIRPAFKLIGDDMENDPSREVYSYKLEDRSVAYDAPLRQLIWSRRGLYTQRSRWKNWPGEDQLQAQKACVIHGHSPYCFFVKPNYFSYGQNNIFWKRQHVFFSESLQSFNIDSNIKGRYENGESYRGLACVCLELLDLAAAEYGRLTLESILNTPDCVFAAPYTPNGDTCFEGDISRILNAKPAMKYICLDPSGEPFITDPE